MADALNTWNAGGNTDLPPIAQASRSNDCSYKAGGASVSAELELVEGYRATTDVKYADIIKKRNLHLLLTNLLNHSHPSRLHQTHPSLLNMRGR
jgi:uncharacterized protein (DUF362 family)